MVKWKALIAFGDTSLVSTICYCLNFQQELNRDEMPKAKLIPPMDIAGKIKIYHCIDGKLMRVLIMTLVRNQYLYIFS